MLHSIHSMKLMPISPSRDSVTHHPRSSSRILYANPVTTFWTSLWKRSVHTCSTAQVLPHAVCSETFLPKSIGYQTLSRGTFRKLELLCEHPECKAVVPLNSLRDHVTRCSPVLARQVLMVPAPSPQSTASVTPSGGRPETPLTPQRSHSSPFSH